MADDVGDPRSPDGQTALALSGGPEGEWINMQTNTFLNWVNQSLSTAEKPPLDSLVTGFGDGTKLVALVEALQGRKLGRLNKPLTEHHRVENINLALQALAEDNVRLVNIGAEDIVKENLKLILGLVWHIILKYQIGKTSKIPSKKLMLCWVQAVLPELRIGNFTTDWNSGIALHALLDYCDPGTSANWRQLHRENGLANCRSAMVLAKAKFGVPQIMQPEDLSSPHVDELSAMTYLSYFMNLDSPGYKATMRWANRMLAASGRPQVANFTTDWVNGEALCSVLRAMGAPPALTADSPKHRVERCYDRARADFRVEPVLTADEFANQDVDYLGVMAYTARLERACPNPLDSGDYVDAIQSSHSVQAAPPPPPPPPPAPAPRANLHLDTDDFGSPTPNRTMSLILDLPHPVADKSAIFVEVDGPRDTRPQARVTWLTDSRARVEFTPVWAGRHVASVVTGGVEASPLAVDIGRGSLHDVRLEVPSGLRSSRVTEARLDARCLGGSDVRAELRSPAGRATDVPVTEISPGFYGLRLLGSDPGEWQLRVWIDDEEIPNSPVSLVLLDSASVTVESPKSVVTGTDTFVVVRHAAGARLSAHVSLDGESVPCFVEDSDGDRKIHFSPNKPGIYAISIHYGDEELRGSPFQVHVRNQEDPTVDSAAIRAAMLRSGVESRFVVHTANAGPGELEVRILTASRTHLHSRVLRRSADEVEVEFRPTEAGLHHIDLSYGDRPVRGSPFSVLVLDPDRLRVTFDAKTPVGKAARVGVNFSLAGEAPVALKVFSPAGRQVAVRETGSSSGQGECHFEYTPTEPGPHRIAVTFGGAETPGGPFVQTAQAVELATAYGEGLSEAHLHRPTHFFVDPKGQKGDLFVQVDGPTSISACNIEPQQNGQYKVSYTPEEVGHYSVQVRWNDKPIPGSPFSPLVLDLGAVRCVSGGPVPGGPKQTIPGLIVGRQHKIVYDTTTAGPGRLTAEVEDPRGEPVQCAMRGDSFIFTPASPGQHLVRVKFGDRPLPDGPLRGVAETEAAVAVTAADFTKVLLSGRGLKEARVGEACAFLIDGSQAGRGKPAVRLMLAPVGNAPESHDADVTIQRMSEDKYKCVYTAQRPGAHLLYISWSDRPLRGSPFRVAVLGPSEASRILCSGEGLHQGVIGQEIKSLIDTRMAGPGDLTARCVGPTKPAYCELYDHQNGTYTLSIKPQESGKHELVVEYNGDQVPGSPFSLRVSAAPDASRVHVYGPGVEHGVLGSFQSRFVCETKGAGAGQLTVRIRGPRGAFRVEMEREYQKDRTIICRYDPTETGEYQLHIKWSGVHVPGSPFVVNIFRSQADLTAFMERHPVEPANGNHGNGGVIFDF